MINRKIVDHITDINLPYTENSRRYLLDEGIDGKTIFMLFGSPMREVLRDHADEIEKSEILTTLNLEQNKYILFQRTVKKISITKRTSWASWTQSTPLLKNTNLSFTAPTICAQKVYRSTRI